jgi:RNA polymerase sigma factor (sigma-70 family)
LLYERIGDGTGAAVAVYPPAGSGLARRRGHFAGLLCEWLQAERLLAPIEQAGAWLFRVARNRITDLFRKRRTDSLEALLLEEVLPSADGGPEAAYARGILVDVIGEALEELPRAQREVFVGHEIDGKSFAEMAAENGVAVNTLLSRKRYAVLALRRRLQVVYDELKETL